jgi:hypothetical protein
MRPPCEGVKTWAVEMPTLWKSQNDFHKGLGKLAQNASFPHFHKPYSFIDDRTRPESVTYVSGLFCYRCFRLDRVSA